MLGQVTLKKKRAFGPLFTNMVNNPFKVSPTGGDYSHIVCFFIGVHEGYAV
jgi:hypothetical protein